jgi:hypothetical protein
MNGFSPLITVYYITAIIFHSLLSYNIFPHILTLNLNCSAVTHQDQTLSVVLAHVFSLQK